MVQYALNKQLIWRKILRKYKLENEKGDFFSWTCLFQFLSSQMSALLLSQLIHEIVKQFVYNYILLSIYSPSILLRLQCKVTQFKMFDLK